MRTDLDTKLLGPLAARVAMLCDTINDPNSIDMGKDISWSELTFDALPKLKEYLLDISN